ncbi:Gas vesicle protein GvpM [Methanosarcina barkeri str. Wiesmoor]|uniref:Gas vesicle protein GvpM n=2 Tax=Methanosarcina barkeri TaxID=2208 RepID=A0A0E3LKQ1_METBA|nr:gas vesicle protein [Methanosarcina barkeri]AKB49911.1 Gas vesicle protein GvpM [Methanosarcina barkeri str. Wiesmoor]
MMPEREQDSLVELLDRLLNKGLVLNADVLITVAGVPLIGLSLKLLAAGIETMLEYGVFEQFDQSTRAWALEHRVTSPTLMAEEETKMNFFGSYSQNQGKAWNYGYMYLTNRRIFGWHKAFNKILYEVELKDIQEVVLVTNVHEEKERKELCIKINNDSVLSLHSVNIESVYDTLISGIYSE